MHSNKKIVTLFTVMSLFIAILFLMPKNEASADVNPNAPQTHIKHHKKGTRRKKSAQVIARSNHKIKKHHKKSVRFVSVNNVKRTKPKTRLHKRLSRSNAAAKAWIAMRESSGSYTASNGTCYGKYQLLLSYYHGDLSHKNQERTANRYVRGRYGSWKSAKSFWQAHHWY
jgi:colicin import membrane protein